MHIEIDLNDNVKLVVHCEYKAGTPAVTGRAPENCSDSIDDELIFEHDDVYMIIREDRKEGAIIPLPAVVLFYDELIEKAREIYKEESAANRRELDEQC